MSCRQLNNCDALCVWLQRLKSFSGLAQLLPAHSLEPFQELIFFSTGLLKLSSEQSLPIDALFKLIKPFRNTVIRIRAQLFLFSSAIYLGHVSAYLDLVVFNCLLDVSYRNNFNSSWKPVFMPLILYLYKSSTNFSHYVLIFQILEQITG